MMPFMMVPHLTTALTGPLLAIDAAMRKEDRILSGFERI